MEVEGLELDTGYEPFPITSWDSFLVHHGIGIPCPPPPVNKGTVTSENITFSGTTCGNES